MDIKKAIILAIENVKKEGLTDIFPRPHELDALKNPLFQEFLIKRIKKGIEQNSLSELRIHPIQHVLFPKKEPFDFRRAALIQPEDTIASLALVLSIADDLEKKRPLISKKRVFSYRFKPKNGYLFNSQYNFSTFNRYVVEKTKRLNTKILVKCDIANFYDRINLHRLESTLLSLNLDKKRVGLINELLLFWANRDSYSIPIGSNASRILAEASLLSVDDYLISHKINFCRFVDDYRFFAPNAKLAHQWLNMFVERLLLEGLSINTAKTSLEDVSNRQEDRSENVDPKVSLSKLENIPVILIVGYTGTIPTKFREISEKECLELRKKDLQENLQLINNTLILQPDDVRKLIKIIVAHEAYEELIALTKILDKFPQFIPITIDLVIKKANFISASTRSKILSYFKQQLSNIDDVQEYILLAIVRLLSTDEYQSKDSLLNLFRNLKRSRGTLIGRSIIDALFKIAHRNDVIEIRQYFNRADIWERRSIIKLVNQSLSEEEKRPWLKNIKIHMNEDIFAIESFSPKKEKKD